MKKLINKKECVILYHSNIINKYPEIKELLQKNPFISDEMINDNKELSESKKNLFLSGAYKKLVSDAFDEWYAEKISIFDNKSGIRCSLCNRVNHTICYIKNRNDDNETELNVGKDCIKHFPNLTDDDNKYYDIVEQVKEIQKTQNFNMEFKNFDQTILYYEKALDNSPFLVNRDIFTNVTRTLYKIKELKKNYIEGRITKACFNDIRSKINELDKWITISLKSENEKLGNNQFACTRELARFIMFSDRKDKDQIIEKLRINKSCIDSKTIKYFSYLPFIEKFLNDYKEITSKMFYDIRIFKGNLYVTIKNRALSSVVFYTTPQRFMYYLGELVFCKYDKNFASTHKVDSYLTLKNLLSKVFILDDSDSNNVYLLIQRLNRFFDFHEFLYDYEKRITYIVKRNKKEMIVINNINFIVKHLLIYFDYNSENIFKIDLYFNSLCRNKFFNKLKWRNISDDDINEINKCRKMLDDFDILVDSY